MNHLQQRYTHEQLVQWLDEHGPIGGGADPLLDVINQTTLPEVNQDAIEGIEPIGVGEPLVNRRKGRAHGVVVAA